MKIPRNSMVLVKGTKVWRLILFGRKYKTSEVDGLLETMRANRFPGYPSLVKMVHRDGEGFNPAGKEGASRPFSEVN